MDTNIDNDADGLDLFHTVCNQGHSEVSDFTCPLCGHVEGDIPLALQPQTHPMIFVTDLYTN
jgi:hypothetical protein